MGLPLQAKGNAPVTTPPAPAPAKTSKSSSQALLPPSTPSTDKDKAKTTVAKTSDKPAPSPSLHPAQNRASGSTVASNSRTSSSQSHKASGGRLARLTAYWSGEGDYYTGRGLSSTGIHLHEGHCAVDPRIIPYGSVVQIDGLGKYLAVDTGSAVISREAARETGHNPEERNALVIDLYFESRRDGERFAAHGPKYAAISWTAPRSTASNQDVHGSLAAE